MRPLLHVHDGVVSAQRRHPILTIRGPHTAKFPPAKQNTFITGQATARENGKEGVYLVKPSIKADAGSGIEILFLSTHCLRLFEI